MLAVGYKAACSQGGHTSYCLASAVAKEGSGQGDSQEAELGFHGGMSLSARAQVIPVLPRRTPLLPQAREMSLF